MTDIVSRSKEELQKLAIREYEKYLKQKEIDDKLKYEKEQLYLNGEVCEICYSNPKCKKHICKECNNSICIECISKMKIRNRDKYSLLCPYCRTDETYNFSDLSKEDLIKFYINLDNSTTELLKPVNKRAKHLDYLQTIMEETIQLIKNSKDDEDSKFKLYSAITDYKSDIKSCIYDDYENTLRLYKNKIEDLEGYKKSYGEYEKYREYMKNAFNNQKIQLQEQSNQLQQQSNQLQQLINQNKELLNIATNINNYIKENKKQPKQSIKTIETIIKPIIEKQYTTFTLHLSLKPKEQTG